MVLQKTQKMFRISDINIGSDNVDALIELHAFSRNVCISSFFPQGEKVCFKTMIASSEVVVRRYSVEEVF